MKMPLLMRKVSKHPRPPLSPSLLLERLLWWVSLGCNILFFFPALSKLCHYGGACWGDRWKNIESLIFIYWPIDIIFFFILGTGFIFWSREWTGASGLSRGVLIQPSTWRHYTLHGKHVTMRSFVFFVCACVCVCEKVRKIVCCHHLVNYWHRYWRLQQRKRYPFFWTFLGSAINLLLSFIFSFCATLLIYSSKRYKMKPKRNHWKEALTFC